MTSLSDLDRLHAAHDQRFPSSLNAARWHDRIDREWPALRAYVAALEAERELANTVLEYVQSRYRGGYGLEGATANDALMDARLATDAARAKMEKQ